MEHKWFKRYLAGRSHSVSVDGHFSDPLPPVSIGVPQGSILGPLLFCLFLNDLPTVTESCETNADDTEIDFASKPDCPEELENNLNSDLCKISEYFYINSLSLNVPKCEFILIGTYQSQEKCLRCPFISTMNIYITSLFLNILACLLIPTLSGMIILTT